MVDLTGRDWTEFYFDDALSGFLSVLRQELPEFTEIDPHDPLIQLAYMVGQLAHRDAGMIDLGAGEMSWPTMLRRSSAIANAAFVGHRLLADRPAGVNVLLDLVGTPGPADVVLPEEALFSSLGDADTELVRYESQAGDVAVGALTFDLVASAGGVFGTPAVGSLASPWGAAPQNNDAIYYGHAALLWDAIQLVGTGSPDDYVTTLEYHDGRFRLRTPDTGITVAGSQITMGVDGLLFGGGLTLKAAQGLRVRVICLETGLHEDVVVAWGGGANTITTLTPLGQAVPSTDPFSYLVSAEWLPFPVPLFSTTGAAYDVTHVATSLPDEAEAATAQFLEPWRRWQASEVAGLTRYWLRERVISVGGAPVAPTVVTAAPSTETTWTVSVDAIQGQSVRDTLGTSTGGAFQIFDLSAEDYVEGSIERVDVAGTSYSEVSALYGAAPEDLVFQLIEDPDGTYQVLFGDGTNGSVPPAGALITAFYRSGATGNGNIGRQAIDSVEAGSGFLGDVRNPRPGAGWQVREANDTPGLERVKRIIPGAVRANDRMVTPDDVESVIMRSFRTADGRAPYSRVVPVVQGAGFKTTLVVCVPAGDVQLGSDSDLDELATFCNGSRTGLQRFGGRALSNQEVVPVLWVPATFQLIVDLWVVKRWAAAAEDTARPALAAAMLPTATTDSGEWRWWTGQQVTDGNLKAIVGAANVEGLVDVAITSTPALPFLMSKVQLPWTVPDDPSAIQINVHQVS